MNGIRRSAGAMLLMWALAAGPVEAAFRVEPGPEIMSEEERALVSDPEGDLPPFQREPRMPPTDLVRASLLLYYVGYGVSPSAEPGECWRQVSRRRLERIDDFLDDDDAMQAAVEGMELPEDSSLAGKLQAVHDWLAVNIDNYINRTSEEREGMAEVSWTSVGGGQRNSNTDRWIRGFKRKKEPSP